MYQTLLASTAALLTACAAASSSPDCGDVGPSPCRAGMVDVTILDRTTGERLTVYSHEGQRWGRRNARPPLRRFGPKPIAGPDPRRRVGRRHQCRQRRHGRLGPERLRPFAAGVVRHPRMAQIAGPRRGLRFYRPAGLLCGQDGRPDDVGVIGVAVFREAARVPAPGSLNEAPLDRARSAPQAGSSEQRAEQRLGTGHGDGETSRVLTTSFERAQDRPDQGHRDPLRPPGSVWSRWA